MEYKIYYPQIPNMGDLLNKDMLESLFNISVIRTGINDCNMLAIGSCLKYLLYSEKFVLSIKERIRKMYSDAPFYVWGTGFANYNTRIDNGIKYKNFKILSLRGNLSRQRLENVLCEDIDVPLGDGGLLAEKWLGYKPEKKYRVGIIPHFREKDYSLLSEIKNHYPDSIIIDLGESPMDVVKKIASCELILSSSLHGLIISDSFHIPNKHITLYPFGERIKSDGFKFADYYSSYGLKDSPIDMSRKTEWPAISTISSSYQIDSIDVEKKKTRIFNVFPK